MNWMYRVAARTPALVPVIALAGIAEARTKTPTSPGAAGFVMGVIALMGIAFVAWGYFQRSKVAKVKNWPQVPGRILSSGVRTEVSRSRRGRSTTHYFDVRYAFAVDGTDYESDNFQVGIDQISPSDIPRLQAKYPAGANVTVQYNPARPRESVLEAGDNGRALIIIGAIIVLIGIAGAAFFLTR